jgi:hypothetical protein
LYSLINANTNREENIMGKGYVVSSGPEADFDIHGECFPVWFVTIYNSDEEDIDGYTRNTMEAAVSLANRISDEMDIEHVDNAFQA